MADLKDIYDSLTTNDDARAKLCKAIMDAPEKSAIIVNIAAINDDADSAEILALANVPRVVALGVMLKIVAQAGIGDGGNLLDCGDPTCEACVTVPGVTKSEKNLHGTKWVPTA